MREENDDPCKNPEADAILSIVFQCAGYMGEVKAGGPPLSGVGFSFDSPLLCITTEALLLGRSI